MIKNVIFNLQDTYMTSLESFLETNNVHVGNNMKEWLYQGQITEKQFWEYTIGYYHNDYVESMSHKIRDSFQEIEATKELVKEMSENGLNIGLASDHSQEWIAYITENFPIQELFPKRYYSFEQGRVKSDPLFWSYAIRKLGMEPDETHVICRTEEALDAATKGPAQIAKGSLYQGIKHHMAELV